MGDSSKDVNKARLGTEVFLCQGIISASQDNTRRNTLAGPTHGSKVHFNGSENHCQNKVAP